MLERTLYFTAQDGRRWTLVEKDFGDGDVDFYLTEPGGQPIRVNRSIN